MLTRQLLASVPPTKSMQQVVSNVVNLSAIEHALDARCSESEDSSDDSYSSDGSTDEYCEEEGEEEIDLTVPITPTSSASISSSAPPRRPTSLSTSALSDRRASTPSQRSPLSISSARSISSYTTCPTPSPRTPSVSMRHDAALRSFQQKRDQETHASSSIIKQRPAKMDMSSLPKVAAPRIEIVQVYDDGESEVESPKSNEEITKADSRSAARKRMMSTLGRGSQAKPTMTLPVQRRESRRVPSLDQLSTIFQSRGEEVGARTPIPKTPGTASPFHHQRNVSCPTPTTPYGEQYGDVHVFVTPPTPRPQGPSSPRIGVEVSGIMGRRNRSHSDVSEQHLLAPPAFELAPGKHRAMEAQKANAIAWLASWQSQQDQLQQIQQQQMILASMQYALPHCYDLMTMSAPNSMAMGAPDNNIDSPSLIPGTPGAPSMIHIQQQKAILAQQQMMMMMQQQQQLSPGKSQSKNSASPRRSEGGASNSSPASTKSSWWRSPQSSGGSPDSGSSCSVYSKSSGAYSSGQSSPADSSPVWRRKEVEAKQSPEIVRSAGSAYVPPGKRAAMTMQQQQQQHQPQPSIA